MESIIKIIRLFTKVSLIKALQTEKEYLFKIKIQYLMELSKKV
jgi:hypothetical protein